MNWFKKTPLRPLVVVASPNPAALALLPPENFAVREAWSTRGALELLASGRPALVIADPESLIETPDLPRGVLQTALDAQAEAGVPVVNAAQFVRESSQVLGQTLLGPGGGRAAVRFLPPRVVLICNYCGGVGKTTLALTLARRFRQQSGLPAAVLEAGLGASALQARLTGERRPSLYDIVTQNTSAQPWERVDVYPLDGREAQLLASDPRTPETLRRIAHEHTLTVLDAFPGNPLWNHALTLATHILIVTQSRAEALAQTESMAHDLGEWLAAVSPPPEIRLILNMAQSFGQQMQLGGQAAAILPFDERKAARLDGTLADPVLQVLYPGWAAQRNPQPQRRKEIQP